MTREELDQLTDSQFGKIIAPSSEELGFLSKLGNALAGRRGLGGDLFGVDSETIGRQTRASFLARELAADADEARVGRKRTKDIFDTFDINEDGTIAFKELPLSEQKKRRSEGQVPQKTLDISSQVQGPTRPLFETLLMPNEDQKGIMPTEFGGVSGSREDIGLSDFGQKAMNAQGNDLLTALVGSGKRTGLNEDIPGLDRNADPQSSRVVEDLIRQFDPGLQASKEVEDVDAAVPMAIARQAFDSFETEQRTPDPKESGMETVDTTMLRKSASAILQAGGMSEVDADMLSMQLPEGMSPSIATNVLTNMAGSSREVMKQAGQDRRRQEVNKAQIDQIKLRGSIQGWLQESGSQLTQDRTLAIKQVVYEHTAALQEGRIDARRAQAEEADARRFAHQLDIYEKKEAFTREDHELNRAAAYGRQVLRGEQALDIEGVRQINRLAIHDKKPGQSNKDAFELFLTDFMKANPAVSGQLVDILATTPPGENPFTTDSIRGALSKRVREIIDARVVEDTIKVATTTDIYDNTMAGRLWALDERAKYFLRGDPENGIPPMNPSSVKPMFDAVENGERFMRAGSPSTNIKVDINEKPMNVTDAAKFTAMKQALSEMDTVSSLLFDEDGNINRSTVASSSEIEIPLTGISMKGLPFTQGRELRQSMLNAVEARLRAESGAAVPDTEVIRAAERFFPSTLDSDKAIRNKIQRFKEYVGEAISLVDPVGTQRSRASSNRPVQSLQDPAQQKSFDQRFKELSDRGLSKEKVFEQLEQEGY